MYVALSAQQPFGKSNMYHLLKRKLANEFTPLRKLLPSVSPALDQVISQAMNADPNQRPADCKAFIALLQPSVAAAPTAVPVAAPVAVVHNKRKAVRYATALPSSCLVLANSGSSWKATVIDVSANGLCLQMERRFEPKTTLQVVVTLGADESLHTFVVHVRWVKAYGERAWLLGCNFVKPLTQQELDKLLISGSEKTRLESPPP
jgi:hypothetical protein